MNAPNRILAAILLVFVFAFDVRAVSLSKPTLLNLQFEQRLNAEIPLTLSFTNEHGAAVQLADYFGSRPVILILGYYGCPMLCGMVLNGVVETLQDMRGTPGQDFDILFVSIDPRESPTLAAAKKQTYVKRYGRANSERGWHFLVGPQSSSKALCDAVGFQYAYDSSLHQYAHPSGIIVLTPEGKTAQYFFGVTYPARDVSAAIKSAAAHRVGSPVRRLLILCFQHMPLMGKNSAGIMAAVRTLAVITLLAVAAFVALSIVRERRRRSQSQSAPAESASA